MTIRALCCGLLLLVAGCGDTKTVTTTVTGEAAAKQDVGAPLERVEFGYVKSLTRKGDGYELRFDPATFLSGETANVAAAEDGKVEPGEPVPNDNYVVDEGHRLFTYLVPVDAKVTVLTESPDGTPISVAELAQIVDGDHKPLWEPITTGFWLRYRIDTVSSLDQQYRP
jgi:hypothetical protein